MKTNRAPENRIEMVPFRGGVVTSKYPITLPDRSYSAINNIRNLHPGFETRPGSLKLHTTALDGYVMSLYCFTKGAKSETNLFAQLYSGEVLKATALPPTVTTGAFGSAVMTQSGTFYPANWAVLNDIMVFCNGANYPRINVGDYAYPTRCVIYRDTATLPQFPTAGEDHTDDVGAFAGSTAIAIGTLGSDADHGILIGVPVIPNTIKLTVGVANTATATMTGKYWNGSWTSLTSFTDNTAAAGKTLAVTGTLTFTAPTDILPTYMFGSYLYWIYIQFSAQLASPTLTAVEYTGAWQAVADWWDGNMVEAVEAQVYIPAGGGDAERWNVYGGTAIDLSLPYLFQTISNGFGGWETSVSKGVMGDIYVAFPDPIEVMKIDVLTPQKAGTAAISSISYWSGEAWVSTYAADPCTGFTTSGLAYLGRKAKGVEEKRYVKDGINAYWYKIATNGGDSNPVVPYGVTEPTADVDDIYNSGSWGPLISVSGIPYFYASRLGGGVCCCPHKSRMIYSFNLFPNYLYLTARGTFNVFSGLDSAIRKVGDGRANKIAAMRTFYIPGPSPYGIEGTLIWQEEVGYEGGSLSFLVGDTPTDLKLNLISPRLGTMNSNTVSVVENMSVNGTIKTLAFFLSRKGVFYTDGITCKKISDDIDNYFDPLESECIRYGYEWKMWMAYDSKYNVLRLGLISSSSVNTPNIFPVYDLEDGTWSFDALSTGSIPYRCMREMGGGNSNVPTQLIVGGTSYVALANSSYADMTSAYEPSFTMELQQKGEIFQLSEMVIRFQAISNYDIVITAKVDGGTVSDTKTIEMAAEVAGQTIVRKRVNWNLIGSLISLTFTVVPRSSLADRVFLADLGLRVEVFPTQ